ARLSIAAAAGSGRASFMETSPSDIFRKEGIKVKRSIRSDRLFFPNLTLISWGGKRCGTRFPPRCRKLIFEPKTWQRSKNFEKVNFLRGSKPPPIDIPTNQTHSTLI